MTSPLPSRLRRRALCVSAGVHLALAMGLVSLLDRDVDREATVQLTSVLDADLEPLQDEPPTLPLPFPEIEPPPAETPTVELPDWGVPAFDEEPMQTPATGPNAPFSDRLMLIPPARLRARVRTRSQTDTRVVAERPRDNSPAAVPSQSSASQPTASQPTGPQRSAPVDATTNRRPAYPALARTHGWTGVVLLEIEVDERGGVRGVVVKRSSGYAVLDQAARAAAADWTFSPATEDGRAIRAVVFRKVRFTF